MRYVSPGVYVREIDLSLYIPALSSTIAGMVGTAVKGPVNSRVFVSSVNQFLEYFGNPADNYFLPYAALQYLRRGSQLWVVRVAGATAAAAAATLNVMRPAILAGTSAPVTISTANQLKVIVTDNRIVPTLTYTDTVTIPAATYDVNTLAFTVNGLLSNSAILSNLVGASYLPDTGSTSQFRLISYIADPLVKIKIDGTVVNSAHTVLGFAPLSTPTAPVGTPSASGGTLATATYKYEVTAIGPSGETTASPASSGQVVTGPTGSVALTWGAVTGATSYRVYGRLGTLYNFLAEVATNAYTDTGAAVEDATRVAPVSAVFELPGTNTGKQIVLSADSVGSWGNSLSLTIAQKKGWVNDISVYQSTPTNSVGYRTEILPGVDLNNVSTNNNFLGIVAGTVAYPIASSGRRSNKLLYTNTGGGTALPAGTRFLVLQTGTFTLTGGDDANGSVTDASYIGITNPIPTGLQLFANADDVDVNIVMVPGITSAAVVSGMIGLCEDRQDCMAIIDTPLGYNPQQVVDWHNGQGAFVADHAAFNSSYAAMYWPWLQIFDAYNNKNVWVPPCGMVSAVYAWTDFIAETWVAPAGLNRAHLDAALLVYYNASLGERELMYGNQNAINPIVNFPKDGITVWGQKTLQRAPTALDRVNVRRLLLYMKKVVATAAKYLVFEPNDEVTWRQFTRLVTPFCQSVKERRGLYDFKVLCDATTNTPFYIDQNTMVGKVFLQPVKAAERIQVDFVITPTGASFDELLF